MLAATARAKGRACVFCLRETKIGLNRRVASTGGNHGPDQLSLHYMSTTHAQPATTARALWPHVTWAVHELCYLPACENLEARALWPGIPSASHASVLDQDPGA